MSAPESLERARLTASAYRIRKSQRGFHLWKFFGWSRDPCGWQIIVADLATREDAEIHLNRRLGLDSRTPPDPLPAIQPTVSYGDPEWL